MLLSFLKTVPIVVTFTYIPVYRWFLPKGSILCPAIEWRRGINFCATSVRDPRFVSDL